MRKDDDWYGHMINHTFCSKKVFHWCYIINLFTPEILFNTMKTNFVFCAPCNLYYSTFTLITNT